MSRMIVTFLVCLAFVPGCVLSVNVFVEKDWRTDASLYKDDDLKSKVQFEIKREFK